MAARQFTARKTTFPQNILTAIHSSFNHPPFHHITHLVRNWGAVPKDRAWLVLHQFTMSPLCVGLEKSERPWADVCNCTRQLSTPWPRGWLAAAPASCALCQMFPSDVFAPCGLLRPAPTGTAPARHSQLQAAPMFCWIISLGMFQLLGKVQ